MKLLGALLGAIVLGTSCITSPGPTQSPPPGYNVLFIGNSLTYTNDLPGMVASVAKAAGVQLHVRSLVDADHALIDFLIDGSARRDHGHRFRVPSILARCTKAHRWWQ